MILPSTAISHLCALDGLGSSDIPVTGEKSFPELGVTPEE